MYQDLWNYIFAKKWRIVKFSERIIPRSWATDVPDTCRFGYALSIVKSFNSTPICHFILHLQPRAEGYPLFDVCNPETFNLNRTKLLNNVFEARTHIVKIELISRCWTFSFIFHSFILDVRTRWYLTTLIAHHFDCVADGEKDKKTGVSIIQTKPSEAKEKAVPAIQPSKTLKTSSEEETKKQAKGTKVVVNSVIEQNVINSEDNGLRTAKNQVRDELMIFFLNVKRRNHAFVNIVVQFIKCRQILNFISLRERWK